VDGERSPPVVGEVAVGLEEGDGFFGAQCGVVEAGEERGQVGAELVDGAEKGVDLFGACYDCRADRGG
jgi:hypothetical protein